MGNREHKILTFTMTEHKQDQVNGVDVGIIKGYLATWDVDRGKDRFVRGAFSDSIRQHTEKGRQIRMKAYHRKVIGGFPIDKVYEDQKGLYVEGHINLGVQTGQEVYMLAKQGVLSDMSIGYSADEVTYEDGIRIITKSTIWEGSIVDEPMNTEAEITEVKAINTRDILPKEFAEKTLLWDSNEAEKKVRSWAGAEDEPNGKYKSAFIFYNQENVDSFGGYKLLVSDIIEGQIKIVPRAVFAVRAVLSGARGGVDISAQDQEKAKTVINALYKEMDLDEPFLKGKSKAFCLTEIKNMPIGLLSHVLRKHELSKDAADYAAQGTMTKTCQASIHDKDVKNFVSTINKLRKEITL
jgi:HK97 family phage prohead protease